MKMNSSIHFVFKNNLYPGNSQRAKIFLIFSAILIIYLKAPNIVTFPRFWAEEGSQHFKFAYENNLIDNMLFVYWRAGYYNFFANFAAGIASLMPLSYAPFVTTGFAFVVQLVPFIILVTGKSYVFDKEYKKIFGFLVLAFLPSLKGEVWLNTINSQVWFGVIGLLLLLENFENISRKRQYFYRSLFFIGGLTGLYLLVFYPFFLLKTILEKNKETIICFFILTLTLSVQLVVFYLALDSNVLNEKRLSNIGIKSIEFVFFYQFIVLIIGNSTSLLLNLFITISCFYVIVISINAKDKISIILLLSWISMAVFTILGSFHGSPSSRYSVVSGYILLFFLIHNSNLIDKKSMVATLIIIISIYTGFYNYKEQNMCDGKNWNNEVNSFLEIKEYNLTICPKEWKFRLVPQ